jgi:hypothetical protein
VELGLKTADLLKLFNSRACQLVLGAGAVSMAGLKTITIRSPPITVVLSCFSDALLKLFSWVPLISVYLFFLPLLRALKNSST